ncbi:MAG: type I glyceraldehyde-3-phosphate dehydrogenase [Candidatus Woesearchaeota archaeon]
MDDNRRKVLVGINGFGTIGRLVYRMLSQSSEIQVAAINDLAPRESLEYLLRHDTNHGQRRDLTLNGVRITQKPDVKDLDWKGIDIVVDSTPHLRTYDQLSQHLERGARTVIRSSPLKGDKERMQTLVLGVNGDQLDVNRYSVFGMASCTTNCLAPLVKVVRDYCQGTGNEIIDLDFVTVHAYTADQAVKDAPHKSDPLRGRDVHNIIEAETGASSQIVVIFPELQGKIFGTAYRVPVSDGSSLELRVETSKDLNLAELNRYIAQMAKSPEMQGILSYETEPLVSGDCINNPHTGIYLEKAGAQIHSRKVKLGALYDNEYGYSSKLVDLIRLIKQQKFDPEIQLFRAYQDKMDISLTIGTCEQDHDADCDCHETLHGNEINGVLTSVMGKNGWVIEESGNYRYQIRTPTAEYRLCLDAPEDRFVLYDAHGEVLTDLAKHEPVRSAIQREIVTVLERRG